MKKLVLTAAESKPDSLRLVINAIAADSTQTLLEKQNTVNYLNTVASVLEQQQTIYTASDNEVNALPLIENNYTTKASVHASSALKARNKNHHVYTIAKFIDNGSNARVVNLFNTEEPIENSIVANTNKFSIYPNPNNGKFSIAFNELTDADAPINILVTNIVGQLMFTETIHNTTNTNVLLQNLQKGIYIVTAIQNQQPIGQSKLIIE